MQNRVCAKVDLQAIRHNLIKIRERVNTRVMVVVKANAYGHGAVEVSRAVEDIVDYFAVATLEEATALRECNIEKPILILGYLAPEDFESAVKHNIELTIFDTESAALLAAKGGRAHIAVDTGMGRIGFAANEKGIEEIKSIKGLDIAGIFTHFAAADEKDKSFTKEQYEKFIYVTSSLESAGIHIPIKHAANSAAAMDCPQYALDMVRSGIITYGLKPSDEVGKFDLKPAMELVSRVVNVKRMPAGVPISYGRTYYTKRESVVATVSVGYADGYPRALSNKGRVIVRGKSAPIVGRVCMDQMMVDVTDIEGVCVGDEVGLITKEITADEIARLEGTINYETVCKISDRVPRIYI